MLADEPVWVCRDRARMGGYGSSPGAASAVDCRAGCLDLIVGSSMMFTIVRYI
jgi:hypothetical protein